MPSVPRYGNFTMEQVEDSEGCRAMQCGRRMFLAALILASKYLQDRNFSTRAWGKISGLKVCEINTNERVFLSAIQWQLHFPSPLFQRWENIVLKYSPSAQAGTPRSCPNASRTWRSIIPRSTLSWINSTIKANCCRTLILDITLPALGVAREEAHRMLHAWLANLLCQRRYRHMSLLKYWSRNLVRRRLKARCYRLCSPVKAPPYSKFHTS